MSSRPLPAAVAYATSTEQVSQVLAFANEHRIAVVPRTGRSATEGGLETAVPDSIVLDGSRMDAILLLDPVNMQVTAQCGVGLQDLDDLLQAQGLTTGHSPQSKPLAQLGGLVATRSIGQLSTLYGGIEDMVVGLEAVLPSGEVVRIKNVPRRAAGPRHQASGDRQRGRAVLHHRGDRQGLHVHPASTTSTWATPWTRWRRASRSCAR